MVDPCTFEEGWGLNSSTQFQRNADLVSQFFSELDPDLFLRSRLPKQISFFNDLDTRLRTPPRKSYHSLEFARQALICSDFRRLALIVTAARKFGIDSDIFDVVRGHNFEDSDKNHYARNKQFELYVRAIMRLAGFQSDCIDPPDIVTHVDKMRFGLACKRVRSHKQLRKRISDAADQLSRTKMQGFAVLDIRRLVHDPEAITLIEPKFGAHSKYVRQVSDNIADELMPICAKYDNTNLLGALVFLDVSTFDFNLRLTGGSHSFFVSPFVGKESNLKLPKRDSAVWQINNGIFQVYKRYFG